MTDCPRVAVNLVVVASLEAFVSKEVNRLVLHARHLLLSGDVLQAVGFVPASRENIERDLAANRVAKSTV